MSTTRTTQETYDSLTGFDEIAIRREFRQTVGQLVDEKTGDPTQMQRALYFIELRRAGTPDAEAYDLAMGAPWSTVRDYFRNTEESGEDAAAPLEG